MDDDDFLPLSALNDLLFCARRCAMHRIEQVWVENVHTLEGTRGHRRADRTSHEAPLGVRTAHGVLLRSMRLKLTGKADIIEFHLGADGAEVPYPVEYKRGRRRRWDNDDVQLCAQALCLEEMLGVSIPAGAVFHIKSRRRREIALTPELRAQTGDVARQLHALVASGRTPPPVLKPRCKGCSLFDLCMPSLLTEQTRLARYRRGLFVVPNETEPHG